MQDYLFNIVILLCVNATLAVTLNFIMGYAGIYSMAHPIFFAVGAYTAAYMATHVSASVLLIVPLAMLLSGLLSLCLALPALRVRGEYFIAASLGLQMLAVTIITEWKSVTGGLAGVIGIPAATIFGQAIDGPLEIFIFALTCLIITLVASSALTHSSFGRSLKSIRESETAAYAAGKNVAVIKTLAVVFSSAFASAAGVVYAFYVGFVNVESFTLEFSVLLMAMVVIGGAGTLVGPLIGATTLMLLPIAFSYLPFLPPNEIGSIQQIAYGAVMVALMVFRPNGIVGRRIRSGA